MNTKSAFAMFLSMILVFQSVDSIPVQAAELTSQVSETAETPESRVVIVLECEANDETAGTLEGNSSDVPEPPTESAGDNSTDETQTEATGDSSTDETQTEATGDSNADETQTETTEGSETTETQTESAEDSDNAETPTGLTGDETAENPTETEGNIETAAENVTEKTIIEEVIAKALEESAESESESENGTTVVVSRIADVVFVIDATGSMDRYINKVEEQIAEFNELLNGADVDVRIKLVIYKDISQNGESSTVCDGWYSTTEDAQQALKSINVGEEATSLRHL